MAATTTKIAVLGGAVIDLVFQVERMPEWSEAVQAHSFRMLPGGKGLNQAIAAARLGCNVHLISAVGGDEFGSIIQASLEKSGVNCQYLARLADSPTAVTNVVLNYEADAAFIGWRGVLSNRVGKAEVRAAESMIKEAKALLITLEVSLEAVLEAMQIARESATLIVLNPAPPLDLPAKLTHNDLQDITCVVPNVWEARRLLSAGPEIGPQDLALMLSELGVRYACVTTAEEGCVVAHEGQVTVYPSFLATPLDTVGGSDAFCAALGLGLAEGQPFEQVMGRANAAGALAVGTGGGSTSMPTRAQVDGFLKARQSRKTTA